MILKLALVARPVLPLALGVATSRYLPAARRLRLSRPVKRNLFVPATPVRVKLLFSVTMRLHFFLVAFFLVGRSQVVFLPWLTLRPGRDCCTVKRTLAATFSV